MFKHNKTAFRFSKEDLVNFSFIFYLASSVFLKKLDNNMMNAKTVHDSMFVNNFAQIVKYLVRFWFLYFTKTVKNHNNNQKSYFCLAITLRISFLRLLKTLSYPQSQIEVIIKYFRSVFTN